MPRNPLRSTTNDRPGDFLHAYKKHDPIGKSDPDVLALTHSNPGAHAVSLPLHLQLRK